MLSEAQGVSLRITSGVRFRRRPLAKGVGLRVADSYTGNNPEDDFTPLKTIRRSYSVIREKISFELEGETFDAKDSITTQTCELSQGEFNDFLALYPIPSEYHVILPKSNQTIFDAPPGLIYRDSILLVVLSLLLLLLCVKPMVVSPLSTSSEGSLICVELEHGQQRPAIMEGGKEMAFRNFIYTEDDEDLAFLPKDPSLGFGIGSPSILVNTKPLKANEEPEIQPVEVITNSGGSSNPKLFVVHPRSVAARIKDRKCLPDVSELKDSIACHLKISTITPPAWKNHLDNHMDFELLDLHDRCYARQAVVDNAVNRRSRELLQVIEKLRGKCDVMRSRERAREEECEGLRVKCEAPVTEMMLESQKSAGYQQRLSSLEWKVTSFEAEMARLEGVEVSLRKEVEELKQYRREVVSKVVPYAAMELVYNDEMGSLVGKLVSFAIVYGR
ncbi:hypothetical protein Tco_0767143 [Tanacetum coccineum]